jgi:hypothetical protein
MGSTTKQIAHGDLSGPSGASLRITSPRHQRWTWGLSGRARLIRSTEISKRKRPTRQMDRTRHERLTPCAQPSAQSTARLEQHARFHLAV